MWCLRWLFTLMHFVAYMGNLRRLSKASGKETSARGIVWNEKDSKRRRNTVDGKPARYTTYKLSVFHFFVRGSDLQCWSIITKFLSCESLLLIVLCAKERVWVMKRWTIDIKWRLQTSPYPLPIYFVCRSYLQWYWIDDIGIDESICRLLLQCSRLAH